MAYVKDSTLCSQMSEYDNVPRLPNSYYLQTTDSRRAFDPAFEMRYNDISNQPNLIPFKGGGGKRGMIGDPIQPSDYRAKPQIEKQRRGVSPPPKLPRFPNPDSSNQHKEEKNMEESFNPRPPSFRQPLRPDRSRVISRVRPQESTASEDDWNQEPTMGRVPSCFFYFLVFLAEILLFGVLILSLVWVHFYRDGFAWREDVKREFNLHPVLMITGFIFLMGHAMLTYRLFGCCSKLGAKLLHTILYLMAVPCIVVSTIAVFDSHDLRETPIPNLYSLHSWMGVVTIGLFGLQLIVGFFSFWMLLLCEQGTSSFRASLVPIHSSFGLVTFMLAIATCVTGLTEKAFFALKNEAGESIYKDLPVEAYIINAMGTALVALGIIIPTLVGIRYFRPSKYRDDMSAHL